MLERLNNVHQREPRPFSRPWPLNRNQFAALDIGDFSVQIGGMAEKIAVEPDFFAGMSHFVECAAEWALDGIEHGKGDGDVQPFPGRVKGHIGDLPGWRQAESCREDVRKVHGC